MLKYQLFFLHLILFLTLRQLFLLFCISDFNIFGFMESLCVYFHRSVPFLMTRGLYLLLGRGRVICQSVSSMRCPPDRHNYPMQSWGHRTTRTPHRESSERGQSAHRHLWRQSGQTLIYSLQFIDFSIYKTGINYLFSNHTDLILKFEIVILVWSNMKLS